MPHPHMTEDHLRKEAQHKKALELLSSEEFEALFILRSSNKLSVITGIHHYQGKKTSTFALYTGDAFDPVLGRAGLFVIPEGIGATVLKQLHDDPMPSMTIYIPD